VALNCVGNGRILREGPFENMWIQPAAGDAGGALGAALMIWHQLLGKERVPKGTDFQKGSLLGPSFSNDEIRAFLDGQGIPHEFHADEAALCGRVADLIASEKVVGWCQGRMEFGPRALGSRSILGDPRSEAMQTTMNVKIKFRESFRPFAPSVLQENVADWFEMREGQESPYMLLVAPVKSSRLVAAVPGTEGLKGLDLLKCRRSDVPAITHVDNSARVQTIDETRHGRYWRLARAFQDRTGCPGLINTSFNVRGEPIVCSPQDAYRCFMGTNMDALVLENCVLLKENQPKAVQHDVDAYLAKFELD